MDMLAYKEFLERRNVKMHDAFFDEFLALFLNSGEERIILEQLVHRIEQIAQLGVNLCASKKFEHLQAYGNLYSMHIDTKSRNLRVLFSRCSNGEILLYTFDEKDGKRRTEYCTHAPKAVERRKEMLGFRR